GVPLADVVHDIGKRVTPVHDNPGWTVFEQADMRIASLFVRHVLDASVLIARRFGTLVSNPSTVFRDQVHVIGSAVPEHHLVGSVIKGNYQVRIVIDSPKLVPLGIKFQAGVKGTKTFLPVRNAGQLTPSEWRRAAWTR